MDRQVIEPMGLGLRGVALRYAHEVRSEEEYFADIPSIELPDDILQVTEHILNMKREDFDTAYLEDRYRTVLVEKLKEKQSLVRPRSSTPAPSPRNVINLMDALKRSLAEQKPASGWLSKSTGATKRASKAKTPAKRAKSPQTN
jgi:DNA end-binding protein Ku